ncbi:MAG: NUDIX hydrolase [Candidatus Gastranaerophilales bacterium]|nr:NUDIX hydrolase [Candidatus Gastranaerophilales bacterium]
MDKLFEKTLDSKEIYNGKVFRITCDDVELSDGYKTKREVVHHGGGVVIAAENNNKILMVRQFRYPANNVLLELPAGKLDKNGEDVLSAAKRELEEETGYIAQNWESLGFIWTSPGFCSEKLFLFKASNLSFKGQHLDEGEILNFIEIDKTEVFNMIKDGRISDSKTIAAIGRAFLL